VAAGTGSALSCPQSSQNRPSLAEPQLAQTWGGGAAGATAADVANGAAGLAGAAAAVMGVPQTSQ
jgi:hypothetical protein